MLSDERQVETKATFKLRLYLWTALVVNVAALVLGLKAAWGLGSVLGFSGSMLLTLWPYVMIALALATGLVLLHTSHAPKLVRAARAVFKGLSSLGFVGFILFGLPILLLGYHYLWGASGSLLPPLADIWVVGNLVLLGAVFLSATRRINPAYALLASVSIYSLAFVLIYFIPDITAYPLPLDWSEAGRYYDASLFYSRLIYGKRVPLPSLDPTRAFLQSLPFLIPSLPIWAHRLWKVLLWLGLASLTGYALAKRLKLHNRWLELSIMAWLLIFSFQGPVYFHLLVIVIVVLLGFDKDRPGRSLLFVGLASLWAGASRVNWFPVAGILAVVLYVLEVPQGDKGFWRYWRWPVAAVVLGLVVAFGAQAGYAAVSGNPPESYVTSFNSPLYVYRLFPNEAYGPGVINLMLTASFPLWLILLWRFLPRLKAWRGLRLLALLSILMVLMAAGLVVSTKIGGGDNLHNLDSYLVILAMIVAYAVFNRFEPDVPVLASTAFVPMPLIALAFLVPMLTQINCLHPYVMRDTTLAWEDIQKIQSLVDEVNQEGGEVLFIQYRHLLPFGMVHDVELVPEYEKVFLMEMAMSRNEAYLSKFWQDLESHRFALIVTEPLVLVNQSSSDFFGEENNAWVEEVSLPLDGCYHTILDLSEIGVMVMAPNLGE